MTKLTKEECFDALEELKGLEIYDDDCGGGKMVSNLNLFHVVLILICFFITMLNSNYLWFISFMLVMIFLKMCEVRR